MLRYGFVCVVVWGYCRHRLARTVRLAGAWPFPAPPMKRSTRKAVAGSIMALLVGAAAGYYSVSSLAQHVAARQVDALLERWQGGAGTATRGRITFSLWTRTLQVSDI